MLSYGGPPVCVRQVPLRQAQVDHQVAVRQVQAPSCQLGDDEGAERPTAEGFCYVGPLQLAQLAVQDRDL